MSEDYTVTVQVLDSQDKLVGQTDSWPVQPARPSVQTAKTALGNIGSREPFG